MPVSAVSEGCIAPQTPAQAGTPEGSELPKAVHTEGKRAPGCRAPSGQACAQGQTALLGLVLWEAEQVGVFQAVCQGLGQGPHAHVTLMTAQEVAKAQGG